MIDWLLYCIEILNNYCSTNPNPCRNGASCVSVSGGGFRCACTTAFTGNLCDYPTGTSNVCTVNTCLNGGVCIPVATNNFVCNCPVGFTGTRCEYSQGIRLSIMIH
jgi:hypothetical protein